jgi:hypothetical protein
MQTCKHVDKRKGKCCTHRFVRGDGSLCSISWVSLSTWSNKALSCKSSQYLLKARACKSSQYLLKARAFLKARACKSSQCLLKARGRENIVVKGRGCQRTTLPPNPTKTHKREDRFPNKRLPFQSVWSDIRRSERYPTCWFTRSVPIQRSQLLTRDQTMAWGIKTSMGK